MLVNCIAYQDGKRLAEIPVAEISEYVKRPDCFVWVALKDPTPEELAQMQEEFDLHPLAIEDAMHGHQRPKAEEYGKSLFVVLHVPEMKGEEVHAGELDIFVGPNYVLTARHGFEHGFQAARVRAENDPHLLKAGSGFVLYALLDEVVDRYFPLVDSLEMQLEKLEERIFTESLALDNMRHLYELKRRMMVMRHAVEPLIEVVHKLVGGRVPTVCQGVQEYFRDVYDHLARINGTIESIREILTTAIQVNLALIGIADNEVTKRLAAWGALITVPTLIAGIYGMNFKHMPELDWSIGYPLVVFTMIAIDVVLFLRFRHAKWI